MIIYASNIHVTGGRVLLNDLLRAVEGPCVLFAHSKFEVEPALSEKVTVISVPPTLIQRLIAEWKLRQMSKNFKHVLCFGNLPPIFRLSSKTSVYFQNTLLLSRKVAFKFTFKLRLKHNIERIWLRFFIRNADRVFVQSGDVRDAFLSEFPTSQVTIAPFMGAFNKVRDKAIPEFDFVYVASADVHKNQFRLLHAWKLLAEEGIFPSLALTFTLAPQELLSELTELKGKGLKITNVFEGGRDHVLDLYAKSGALIFPSLTESLGMPLIEAAALGLPIVAAELDYVREFVTPIETFDPTSSKSIARAVKRYLKAPSGEAHNRIYNPSEFLDLVEF